MHVQNFTNIIKQYMFDSVCCLNRATKNLSVENFDLKQNKTIKKKKKKKRLCSRLHTTANPLTFTKQREVKNDNALAKKSCS